MVVIVGADGGRDSNSDVMQLGLGAWNVVTTLIATGLVDRVGRRPLMLVGALVSHAGTISFMRLFLNTIQFMAICALLLGVFSFILADQTTALGVLSIAMLCGFVAAFEAGPGCCFWVILTELFPPELRDSGMMLG